MHLGVRRCMAFLGSTQRYAELEPPTSLALSLLAEFRAFPEPLTEDQARAFQLEFVRWNIGNSLGELDRFLHLFLDEAWRITEIVKDGPVVPEDFVIGTVEPETSSVVKLGWVMDRIAPGEPIQPHWRRFTNARNVLTHQAGRVTPPKAREDGLLKMSWQRLEMAVVDGAGNRTVLNDAVEPVMVQGPGGAVQLQTVDVEVDFEVGSFIALTPQQISEICFFYHRFADSVHDRLIAHCREKDIPVNQPPGEQ